MKFAYIPIIVASVLVVGLMPLPLNAGGQQGQDHHLTKSLTEPARYNSDKLNRQMTESPTAAGAAAEQPAEEVQDKEVKHNQPSRNTPYGNNKR